MGANAQEANRRIGQRMSGDEADWLGAKGRDLLADYERARPTARLRTFEQVEVLWDEVIRPHLKDFESMQLSWDGSPEQQVPEQSPWYANWRVPPRG
jgi:creatinine amidohydrolase